MKLTHAFLGLSAVGVLSFGVVVPASATAHKSAVQVSASVSARTVLVGTPVVVRGAVSPHAAGPVVLERLVADTWTVIARARTTPAGGYSFTVGTAHRSGTWLLQVVRPATPTTRQGTTPTMRIQVAPTAYTVHVAARSTLLYVGDTVDLDGSVSPVPATGAHLEWLEGSTWHVADTVPVGSNGVFAGSLSLPAGTWRVRVVEPASATVASGASAAITVTLVPQLAP